MIFGFKKVPFQLITLLNDDEESPISMIGQKMLPILELESGDFMPESLDIIQYIDGLMEYGPALVQPSQENEQLQQWLQDSRQYTYPLAMPRWINMGLEEFATPGAVQYFTLKKEKMIGPFIDNLKNSTQLVEDAKKHLEKLESFLEMDSFIWGDKLSLDDFHVFATLRVLTAVKELHFPAKVKKYSEFMSDRSGVPLHWNIAVNEEDACASLTRLETL